MVEHAELFLEAMDRKAKMFARSARATFNANRELCAWLMNPLARWAEAAYGSSVFDAAARGYAEYCIGVAKAQKIYESAGKYTPESMPEIISGVYEDEGYMVPYMWAAILIYPFWPSMISHIAMFRDEFVRRLPRKRDCPRVGGGPWRSQSSGRRRATRPPDRRHGYQPSSGGRRQSFARCFRARGPGSFRGEGRLEQRRRTGDGKCHGIISAMLAEHLSDPKPLFKTISHQVLPDGLVFFSTALESPQRDHVFEYNEESQPLQMAERAGLRVSRLASDASATPPGFRFKPRATAMILRSR